MWDMARYGEDVLIAGSFSGPSGKGNNLVQVDGKTGRVIKWYEAPPLKSVLGVPDLGRVYGGDSLSAFESAGSKKRALWSRAKITVDKSLHERGHEAAYRDLDLDGKTIWAACMCDAVNGNPAKALVKLSTEGDHDTSWVTRAARIRTATRWSSTMGSSTWRREAATFWPSWIREPVASAVGCATPWVRRRR